MEDVLKKIQDYALEEIMGDRFGKYAKEIIQDRAIPDIRDGLKPVQRRILYAMYKTGNVAEKNYIKCAATVGEVLGKYHPHGDTSVYDAMVRMSQWWKQNHILIDIQGNNGSMDGDSAAAYRYTEAKLSKISGELLKDLEKNTINWSPNFDDRFLEPTILPAKFPNLLINGANGISAGYATNIPPHNLGEIIDATIKRIDSPNGNFNTFLEIVKGPDFPTGGIVEGKEGIIDAFKTGKGKIIIRSKIEFKKEKGKEQIIVTELPFDVNKANLVNKIDAIRIDKKIEGIAEVRDESDRTGLRIAIDLKNGVNKELILNYLLKNTELKISFNYNMVSIVNRRPLTLGLLEILDAYIEFQKEVITRRSNFDLAYFKKRFHIVEGLIKAISILDEVIKVIRQSKNKIDAIANLIKEFSFTGEQAEAIVMLQLYKLTNTDITTLEEECEKLKIAIAGLKEILSNEDKLKQIMKLELRNIKKEFGVPRRTEIKDEITEIKLDLKKMIPIENVVVVVTNEGYVKKVSYKSYKTNEEETLVKPGDYVRNLFQVTTQDTLLLFTNLGNYLYLPVHKLSDAKWKELGKHISNTILIAPEEKIIGSLILNDKEKKVCLFTKKGFVKKVRLGDFEVTRYSKPIMAMKLKDNDELINIEIEQEECLFVTYNGYYLKYKCDEIPQVGPKASGVKGINLKEDFVILGTSILNDKEYLNIFTNFKTAKRIKLNELVNISRAKKGNMLFKKVKTKDYKIIGSYITDSKDINLIKNNLDIIEIKNSDIPIMDLGSTGSIIIKKEIEEVSIKTNLINFKEKINIIEENEEPSSNKQLSFDSFIDEFKI